MYDKVRKVIFELKYCIIYESKTNKIMLVDDDELSEDFTKLNLNKRRYQVSSDGYVVGQESLKGLPNGKFLDISHLTM